MAIPRRARAIRLGVRTRGCNGMSYTMNFANEPAKLDEVRTYKTQITTYDYSFIK